MTFKEAIAVIKKTLSDTGTVIDEKLYDGIIVKKLAVSNTLDEGRSTNQTHIAVTGDQMDIFPYLCADGYFYEGNQLHDVDLKKFFVISVPVTLFESNLKHLGYEGYGLQFTDGKLETCTSVVRSKRNGQSDQLQVSMLDMDGDAFVSFRRNMNEGTYFILLKCANSMKYHAFGIKTALYPEAAGSLADLNNKFFKTSTNTLVSADVFNKTTEEQIIAEPIPEDLTVEQLGSFLRQMYDDPSASSQTNAIRMFAIKYAKVMLDKGYTANAVTQAAGINDSYYTEVSKGINIYKSILTNEYGIHFYEEEEQENENSQAAFPSCSPRSRKKYPLNCILYGAPGTGKTYSTAQFALAIAENRDLSSVEVEPRSTVMERYNRLIADGEIVFTTFHQNYGYEDFIEGIRPDLDKEGLGFKSVVGVFKMIADQAIRTPGKDFVIIIDEINRANISKVFGELITLIEEDKRWGEENAIQVTLPSGKPFAVPNNLYIVGTMNSADKSISLVDTALRRRFEFIEYVPNLKLIKDTKLRQVLDKLNTGIAKELNSTDLLIGHSYFMDKTIDALCSILNRNIIPLLYEYFFDNQKKVETQIVSAIEGLDVEVTAGSMGRIKVRKKEDD